VQVRCGVLLNDEWKFAFMPTPILRLSARFVSNIEITHGLIAGQLLFDFASGLAPQAF
jgi:hypothetical protein